MKVLINWLTKYNTPVIVFLLHSWCLYLYGFGFCLVLFFTQKSHRAENAHTRLGKKSHISGWCWKTCTGLNICASLFSEPSIRDKQQRVYFQTPLYRLCFILTECLSRGLDLHPSVYELTLNRWGEETEERKDRAAAFLKFTTSFCERNVRHTLTSTISFIHWYHSLPEHEWSASPLMLTLGLII